MPVAAVALAPPACSHALDLALTPLAVAMAPLAVVVVSVVVVAVVVVALAVERAVESRLGQLS